MNTVVGDWYIVSVYEEEKFIGKVLFGTVIDDSSCRFLVGDYVCSSRIASINLETKLIKTHTGNLYQILEEGHHCDIQLNEFELLRLGYSPVQIEIFRLTGRTQIH